MTLIMWLRRVLCVGISASALLLGNTTASTASSNPDSPPFTECPVIGASSACEILLVINPNQSISVLGDPTIGPYDGSDDTLVGIVNSSHSPVSAVTVSGPGSGLAGFDGDGICTYANGASGGTGFIGNSYCNAQQLAGTDPSDYAGPGTSFTLDPKSQDDVEVDFAGKGLAVGASTYFSLEGALTSAVITARKGKINPGKYVALGDSYSSGEGNPPYLAGTDNGADECHRSALSYPFDAANQLGFYGGNFSFHACAGAIIQDFTNPNHDNPERAQLSWLNSSTKLVTLTIGGNNASFADVMTSCVLHSDCELFWQYAVDRDIARMSENSSSNPVSLAQLYVKIKHDAPNARVLVVGYPRLFPNRPPLLCSTGIVTRYFNLAQMDWIDSKVQQMDYAIRTAAKEAGVTYVDTYNAFQGHELCTSDPYLNGAIPTRQLHILAGSFHPNISGHAALERLVAEAYP